MRKIADAKTALKEAAAASAGLLWWPETAGLQRTGVLAAMLAKRASGYTSLGFSDPRRLALSVIPVPVNPVAIRCCLRF